MTVTIEQIVDKQIDKVLKQGKRLGTFNQIRQRHFWSTYLFIADPATHKVASGAYDIFKAIPGGSGQGYPTNASLTLRETNWLNGGRVPDNQNFAIMEVGATIRNPPLERGYQAAVVGPPAVAASTLSASTGLFASLTAAQQTYLGRSTTRSLSAHDANNIAFGTILEMSFLTNSVPLGLLADFSQSAGIISAVGGGENSGNTQRGNVNASNGLPVAAFRRKLSVPILLSSGENMGMRLTVPRDIELLGPKIIDESEIDNGGTGWYEVRIDWWAIESFVEKS